MEKLFHVEVYGPLLKCNERERNGLFPVAELCGVTTDGQVLMPQQTWLDAAQLQRLGVGRHGLGGRFAVRGHTVGEGRGIEGQIVGNRSPEVVDAHRLVVGFHRSVGFRRIEPHDVRSHFPLGPYELTVAIECIFVA